LKKWSILLAVALVGVIGCGGRGGDRLVPPGDQQQSFVNLPDVPGQIHVNYLTGQGRAVGDTYLVLRRLEFADSFGRVTRELTETRLRLNGYQSQIVPLNVPVPAGLSSRLFESFELEAVRFEQQRQFGPFIWEDIVGLPDTFPARVRVFRGRHTLLPVFIDDAMVRVEGVGGNMFPVFDREQFRLINMAEDPNAMLGFLSDYVMFDLTNLPANARPNLSSGPIASRVFFSGDGYAISDRGQEAGDQGYFEFLTLDIATPVEGRFKGPATINGVRTPGTYNLVQPDPTDPTLNPALLSKITSLHGIWRPVEDLIGNMGAFEAITFPSSRDDNFHDLVFVRRQNNVIVDMYFGFVDFETNEFRAYPIRNIAEGEVDGEVSGTVTNLRTGAGAGTTLPHAVRTGTFTFTTGAPSGFPTSGRFLVFRR
jgi:hypothetical protein